MVTYSTMTNEEIMAYLHTVGGLSEVEVELLSRLTAAVDEIDALQTALESVDSLEDEE